MELFRLLGALAEAPGAEQRRLARVLDMPSEPDAAEYTALFVLQLYPYASVYLSAEGMLGGEARDRVAGFWRALGRPPPSEPDHLAVLLALYATVGEREEAEADRARGTLLRESRRALLWEHLLPWLPAYLDRVIEIGPPFYQAWAGLLQRALLAEAEAFEWSKGEPLHFREAPPLPDPARSGADAFLGALLAPVRSGLILVRADLARAADELGLGLRIGERRFALRHMLGQDAGNALAWFAAEAERRAERYRQWPAALGTIAGFWTDRALTTAATLRAAAAESPAARESRESRMAGPVGGRGPESDSPAAAEPDGGGPGAEA